MRDVRIGRNRRTFLKGLLIKAQDDFRSMASRAASNQDMVYYKEFSRAERECEGILKALEMAS